MRIINLEDLRKNINRASLSIFLITFSLALLGLYFTHDKFIQNRSLLDLKEIHFDENLYQANLSEKLSIIASSTVFLDYLRSGEATRARLNPAFLSQLSSLNAPSIAGMQIIDGDKSLFSQGVSTETFVSLDLCYLNQTLDPIMGECRFIWRLYFEKNQLLDEILNAHKNIQACPACEPTTFFNPHHFGTLPIHSNSMLNFRIQIQHKKDYFFYIYLTLMSISLVVFAIWSWSRLSYLLNRYLAAPLKSITDELKTEINLSEDNNFLEELRYLIAEINSWKAKLALLKTAEHNAQLSRIAAQLAHDIRSPLLAIQLTLKKIRDIPEKERSLLLKATERISEIADNFLEQYKLPLLIELAPTSKVIISALILDIVNEKREQYSNQPFDIDLSIDQKAKDAAALINPQELKRVLSNLINNAIEALGIKGKVEISLNQCGEELEIAISDNGCGIPEEHLPLILNKGLSIGKKGGSGLGLSDALAKVKAWGGVLIINSQVGKGTKLVIKLPSQLT